MKERFSSIVGLGVVVLVSWQKWVPRPGIWGGVLSTKWCCRRVRGADKRKAVKCERHVVKSEGVRESTREGKEDSSRHARAGRELWAAS